MIPVALDTETGPILPGLLAPPLTCVSMAQAEDSKLLGNHYWLPWVTEALENPDMLIIGANVAYDMTVLAAEAPKLLPLIFAKYNKGLVSDVQIREMLLDIQAGEWRTKTDEDGNVSRTGYSLADLAKTRLGVTMDKDTWRMGYGKLRNVPVSEWPEGARQYAIGDAEITLKVWQHQQQNCPCPKFKTSLYSGHYNECNLWDEASQVRAAFALHLMGCWGMRTDPEKVRSFKSDLTDKKISFESVLSVAKLIRPDGTKDTEAIRQRLTASGFEVQKTPTGKIKIDSDSLSRSGDPALETLAEAGGVQKLLTTYVPVLERGTTTPIQCRYYVLARTGRTSCASPNMQNLPREPGVREAFIPRPGFVYAICDYSILELRCLSQVLLNIIGWSKMAEALQSGRELHLALAAQILGISYDEALRRKGEQYVKDARQLAKVGNFGFPGGMGPQKLVDFARAAYGLRLTVEQCEKLRKDWFTTFPEMREYFQWVAKEIGRAGDNRLGKIQQLSGRIRGGVGFTDAANSMFQGLAADGAKAACWEVSKLCYVDKESALFGSRPVAFIHDELILEVPESKAREALEALEITMKSTMSRFVADIPIEAAGLLTRVWSKAAERVEENGKVVPWSF